jgi:hypothetical protein
MAIQTVLARQSRAVGTYTSAEYVIPADALFDAWVYLFLTNAARDDPGTLCELRVERFAAGEWRFDGGIVYQGGTSEGRGGNPAAAPGIIFNGPEMIGQTVRVVLIVNQQTTNVGVRIQTS